MELPDPDLVGVLITSLVGIVVLWDIWLLWRRFDSIPKMGPLPNGGHAWSSTLEQEIARHWSSILALTIMMAAPWVLAATTDTSTWVVVVFDVLLFIHLIGMILPKRYAVTKTHLFSDGQRHEWDNLRLALKQPRGRILLQRKGWSIFAPLPLGGEPSELSIARAWIAAAMIGGEEWQERCKELGIEEE